MTLLSTIIAALTPLAPNAQWIEGDLPGVWDEPSCAASIDHEALTVKVALGTVNDTVEASSLMIDEIVGLRAGYQIAYLKGEILRDNDGIIVGYANHFHAQKVAEQVREQMAECA